MYKCPLCKKNVKDTIEDLQEHRKPDGECERAMVKHLTSKTEK